MKKIYCFLLTAAALISFIPVAKALDDDPPYHNNGGICYEKTISEPNTQGIYTINLESFVTGKVTVTNQSVPADIVLVLDFSNSMGTNDFPNPNGSGTITRINGLLNAVQAFINVIHHNDNYEDDTNNKPRASGPLGNRISVVIFSANNDSDSRTLVGWTDVSNNDTEHTLNTAIYQSIYNERNNLPRGTYSNRGMSLANTLLSTAKEGSSRTVVMFTDGVPGGFTSWNEQTYQSTTTANACIVQARTAKQTYGAKVFTVGLLNGVSSGDRANVNTYMNYVSSNYPDAQGMTIPGTNPAGNPDAGYFQDASTGTNLTSIFTSIAQQSGGSSVDLSESSVSEMDVVSASFTLPPNADESSIYVYTANCTGVDSDDYLLFDEDGLTLIHGGTVTTTGIDVVLSSSGAIAGKKDIITVEGFDFSDNWCGPEESTDDDGQIVTTYRGKKLIIRIPIKMDEVAVGGPGVETNGSGSGIWVDGVNICPFESPKVSLPVNIHINKQGLDEGESSKFTIKRTTDDPDSSTAKWEDVTSVFVTRHKNQAEDAAITKIVGLPANDKDEKPFVYLIVEDDWSWSYKLTGSSPEIPRSDKLLRNPFIFSNEKKTDIDQAVRHAESKATNTFNTGGGATYDDSKTNTRTN